MPIDARSVPSFPIYSTLACVSLLPVLTSMLASMLICTFSTSQNCTLFIGG